LILKAKIEGDFTVSQKARCKIIGISCGSYRVAATY